MAARKVTLDSLSAEDYARLTSEMKEREAAQALAAKAQREAAKGLAADVVTLVTTSDIPRQTFTSTAQGWSLGGKFEGADGNTYKVSILLRDVATIPANDES